MANEFPENAEHRSWAHWIEVPVRDMERARNFYHNIFETGTHHMDLGAMQMAVFPHGDVGLALCQGEWYVPGAAGPIVYLDANPDLETVLARVEPNGGKVLMPKKMISPEHGFMALFLDTEGNRLALHSDR